jgi:2-succinyl-6-hydroxy-2,4-cyclohexadiene-1-carboxylate synthase
VLTDRLHIETAGDGPRVVLVHGFTQTLRSWDRLEQPLRSSYRLTAVDAPGHGLSGAVTASLPDAARLLTDQAGAATYIGYSMGARLCLHAALQRPDLVTGLVLIGGTAGIDDPEARAQRQHDDNALADAIERDGVTAFLDRWMAQPMFANVPDPDGHGRADRLRNTATGLAGSLRLAGTGAQDSLWPRLHELAMPVLVLAGEHDHKFSDIGHRLVAAIGANARFEVVAQAGHAAHLEQPDRFLAILQPWLAQNPSGAQGDAEGQQTPEDQLHP